MIDQFWFDYFYRSLYYIAAAFALLLALTIDVRGNSRMTATVGKTLTITFLTAIMLLVGLRNYMVGADTRMYHGRWMRTVDYSSESDYLFYALMNFIKTLGISYRGFLLLISFLFFFLIYKILKQSEKLYPVNLFLGLLCFFSFFFFKSISINVIRQGLSLVFLVYGYLLLANKKKMPGIIALTIAVSFHFTALIPVILFGITFLLKRLHLAYFIALYFIVLVLSYMSYGINDFAPFLADLLEDDKRASYLEGPSERYVTGFKTQFAIFNTLFLLIFLYLTQVSAIKNKLLLRYYMLSSALFFMAFQLSFSDRWGLFSWIIIPLMMQPFLIPGRREKIPISFVVCFLIFIFVFFNVIYY